MKSQQYVIDHGRCLKVGLSLLSSLSLFHLATRSPPHVAEWLPPKTAGV